MIAGGEGGGFPTGGGGGGGITMGAGVFDGEGGGDTLVRQ